MKLSPIEKEKLLVFLAGELAQKRRERGIKLNYPESVAIISCFVLEGAREGKTVSQLMEEGKKVLSAEEVMEGVPQW